MLGLETVMTQSTMGQLAEHMPVTIYQVADAAARNNKLEHPIFVWELNDPKPVSGKCDLESYEAKIAALVPYMENGHVYTAVMKMRAEIGKVYSSDLRGMIRPWHHAAYFLELTVTRPTSNLE